MKSAFYDGFFRRRRYTDRELVRVPVSAVFLDLAETSEIFKSRWCWSFDRAALAWLRRKDYFGDPTLTLDDSVRRLVFEEIGRPVEGPVRMLSQLRTWGLLRGMANAFYCYDSTDSRIEAVVVDIRSIPGIQPQRRVLDAKDADYDGERYQWKDEENHLIITVGKPDRSLIWNIQHDSPDGCDFDATLALESRPLDSRATIKTLLVQPFSIARLCLTL
ncbi:MAG: hypothetical protein COB53_13435 [Elusimicrobia bacterium]|nr:MAG: hypothetical protein COB53_13435 [Elusimicrobiota bacterium]